ncbi:MAG: hypothetical protein GTN98_14660 [Woeseiaceae bacterium]|nr:hypothetical protein [Woeseiaceae bacterium]
MFIPKGIYETAPYYWIVLGISLIGVGTYLGTEGNHLFLFAGIGGGTIACIWGLVVFKQRISQQSRQTCSTYDEYLDQTCELNVRTKDLGSAVPHPPQD